MTTQFSSKREKFIIIQNFDLSYSIIVLRNNEWHPIAGPYLNKEEAEIDLRVIECEQE